MYNSIGNFIMAEKTKPGQYDLHTFWDKDQFGEWVVKAAHGTMVHPAQATGTCKFQHCHLADIDTSIEVTQ